MKKITLLFMPLIAAALLQACSGSRVASDSDSIGSAANSDAALAMPTVNAADSTFAVKAATSGMAEVELGKMAAEKGLSTEVKNFGSMMVKDHSAANEELAALALQKKVMLPTAIDGPSQQKMDVLSRLSGAEFDKAYVDAMVESHKLALTLMNEQESGGTDADLKAFAAKTAPVVKNHLDEVTKMQASMK